MPCLKLLIEDAKAAVDKKLNAGITVADIPHIADMIESVRLLEDYIQNDYGEEDNGHWFMARIKSEIDAVELYFNKWAETKLEQYRAIARDEAKHADFLIKQALEKGVHEAGIAAQKQRLADTLARLG